jgi:xylose isomerase
MNGAATNPDAHVFAYAAAQVKKGLEIAKKLGAVNFGEKSAKKTFFVIKCFDHNLAQLHVPNCTASSSIVIIPFVCHRHTWDSNGF